VPRTKYTQPPGPFPPLDQIRRASFRFKPRERLALGHLLPDRLRKLTVPDDYQNDAAQAAPCRPKTMADLIVCQTEVAIGLHLTGTKLPKGARMPSPANVRAAIRRLRTALKPFVHGWVDDDTASLIPHGLDERLAARARELESIRVGAVSRRLLTMTCQRIESIVRLYVKANRTRIEKSSMRKFVAQALDFAGIEYPDPASHPERLDKLIFPPPTAGQRQNKV
jgi:hypothetical protein